MGKYNFRPKKDHLTFCSDGLFFGIKGGTMAAEIENKINNYLDRFICGDTIEVMSAMPGKSIDLVVTSPPYNLKNSTGNGMKAGTKTGRWANNPLQNGYTHHGDDMPYDKYISWQRECLTEMMRLLKETGAIFYNHKTRVQAGLLQDRYEILDGFPVRQCIIWQRKGGFNFNPGYFVPTYEVIYLIAKPKFKLVKGANGHGDIWEFTQEMKNSHPAPFPIALPTRFPVRERPHLPPAGSAETISALIFHQNTASKQKTDLPVNLVSLKYYYGSVFYLRISATV
jgi:site-specific DNA-methyltransferase (adenine-specific)